MYNQEKKVTTKPQAEIDDRILLWYWEPKSYFKQLFRDDAEWPERWLNASAITLQNYSIPISVTLIQPDSMSFALMIS